MSTGSFALEHRTRGVRSRPCRTCLRRPMRVGRSKLSLALSKGGLPSEGTQKGGGVSFIGKRTSKIKAKEGKFHSPWTKRGENAHREREKGVGGE